MNLFSIFKKGPAMDFSSIISSIKTEIVKVKASPFTDQFEKVALQIAQQVEPASVANEINTLAKIYADLKPVESLLKMAFPQYAMVFSLLDQLLVVRN